MNKWLVYTTKHGKRSPSWTRTPARLLFYCLPELINFKCMISHLNYIYIVFTKSKWWLETTKLRLIERSMGKCKPARCTEIPSIERGTKAAKLKLGLSPYTDMFHFLNSIHIWHYPVEDNCTRYWLQLNGIVGSTSTPKKATKADSTGGNRGTSVLNGYVNVGFSYWGVRLNGLLNCHVASGLLGQVNLIKINFCMFIIFVFFSWKQHFSIVFILFYCVNMSQS